MHQISMTKTPGGKSIPIEQDHQVTKLMKWLPKGETESGGEREHDLIQFVARHGGVRTVRVKDLILL